MLRRLIPLKGRGLPRCRKIRDTDLGHRFFQKIYPESDYLKRALGKLHPIIVGHRGVGPITEIPPVPNGHKADIIMIILKTLAVGADIGALSAVQQRDVLTIIVEDDSQGPLGLTLPARNNSDTRIRCTILRIP